MNRLGKFALSCAVVLGTVFILGPYEPVEAEHRFDSTQLSVGIDAYLTQTEAQFDDIRPNSAKRVIWAGEAEAQTDWAIVYFHGFSASSQEIRPVPDQIAQALGANLVFTRFTGHGRNSAAMAEMRASDWMLDVDEALSIARRVGKKTLIIGTSTGGSLAVIAAADPELSQDVAALVLVSPNFALQNPAAPALNLPAARYWLPLIAGNEREFEPRSAAQGREWTTRYASTALFPMAAVAKYARDLDHAKIDVPVLFLYSVADRVVSPQATAKVAARWGGAARQVPLVIGAGDDAMAHVIAGDIVSPGMTPVVTKLVLDWIGRIDG